MTIRAQVPIKSQRLVNLDSLNGWHFPSRDDLTVKFLNAQVVRMDMLTGLYQTHSKTDNLPIAFHRFAGLNGP